MYKLLTWMMCQSQKTMASFAHTVVKGLVIIHEKQSALNPCAKWALKNTGGKSGEIHW